MRTTPEDLQMMTKGANSTDFACFVKNQMEKPIRLTVMFGEIERRAKLSPQKYEALIQQNRELYGAKVAAIKKLVPEPPREPNLDPEDPLLL
jgi:3-hydroxy-3-methylglutaryl CoA synthase